MALLSHTVTLVLRDSSSLSRHFFLSLLFVDLCAYAYEILL